MAKPDSLSNISSIYSALSSSKTTSLPELRSTWDGELGTELSEKYWADALSRVNYSCACARMCLIQLKWFTGPITLGQSSIDYSQTQMTLVLDVSNPLRTTHIPSIPVQNLFPSGNLFSIHLLWFWVYL